MSKYARWSIKFRDGWDAENRRALSRIYQTRCFLDNSEEDEKLALREMQLEIKKRGRIYSEKDVIKAFRQVEPDFESYDRSTNK